jgi:hypothetical protein
MIFNKENLSDEELQKVWSEMEAGERYMLSLKKFESIKEKVKDENLARTEHRNWVDKMWGRSEDDKVERELKDEENKNELERKFRESQPKEKFEDTLKGQEKEDYLKTLG